MMSQFVKKMVMKPLRYCYSLGAGGIRLVLRLNGKKGIVSYKDARLLHPVFIRRGTSDIPTFEQIFVYRDYELDYECTPKVIIDCGANVGFAAVFFKNMFPDAKIISVEPESSNYDMLVKNTAAYSDIITYKNGIWNKPARLKIENTQVDNWAFQVREVAGDQPYDVEAISIDKIMQDHNIDVIDILKIDIEGSEKELFELNADYWLSRTKVLIIELHDRMRPGSSKAVYKALVKYDFELKRKGENDFYFIKGHAPA